MEGQRKKAEEEWTKNEVGKENTQGEGAAENMLIGYYLHLLSPLVKIWKNDWEGEGGIRADFWHNLVWENGM